MVEVCNIDTVVRPSEFIRPFVTLGLKANDSFKTSFLSLLFRLPEVGRSINIVLIWNENKVSFSLFVQKDNLGVYMGNAHIGQNECGEEKHYSFCKRLGSGLSFMEQLTLPNTRTPKFSQELRNCLSDDQVTFWIVTQEVV